MDTAVGSRSRSGKGLIGWVSAKWPRRQQVGAVVVMGIIAAGIYGAHWWTVGRYLQETDDATIQADVVGIAPKLSGYVVSVAVEDNQTVRAGDVLLRIEDDDYLARVAQAQSGLDAAIATLAENTAALASIEAQIEQQQSAIVEASANVQSAAAESMRTGLDYKRYEQLASGQAVSVQRLQQAEADYRVAQASLESARAALDAQRVKIGSLNAQSKQANAACNQAQAQIGQARATLSLAQIDLANTIIRSPVAGVVGQRTVRVGAYVEPGLPLLAIVPIDAAYVIANFKETQLDSMRSGQPADVSIDAYSGATLHGVVDSVSPASGAVFALLPSDNATGNFTKIVQRVPVKILIDSVDRGKFNLLSGLSTEVTVDTRGNLRRGHS